MFATHDPADADPRHPHAHVVLRQQHADDRVPPGRGRHTTATCTPREQTGYLVSGSLRLTIGEEARDLAQGDSWCIPGGTDHGAEVLADSVAVEVFSPVREDYLP